MVLIEGVYSGYDCDGNFYGLPNTYAGDYNADNRIQMRWAGYFESNGFSKEITENDDEFVTNVATREKAILRFKHMPYEKAKLLAVILSADKIFVNGEEWVEKKGFEKNHQLSKEWLPDIEFDRPICDRSTLDCDF